MKDEVKTDFFSSFILPPSSFLCREPEAAEVFERPAHALLRARVFDFVGGRDAADDIFEREAVFEPAPDDDRRLVKLKILLRVEVYEDALARVELREDYVLLRHEPRGAHRISTLPT